MKKKLRTKKIKPIRFRQTLFWDVNPRSLDPKRSAYYISERIMQFGNDQEVRWMWHTYPHTLLKKIAHHSRGLDPQSKALWSLLLK